MMVNVGTRVAPGNIAFSRSRKAALIQRKLLQFTTLSIKYHQHTLSEIHLNIYKVRRACMCLNTLRGPETTFNFGHFNKNF